MFRSKKINAADELQDNCIIYKLKENQHYFILTEAGLSLSQQHNIFFLTSHLKMPLSHDLIELHTPIFARVNQRQPLSLFLSLPILILTLS